MSAIRNKYKFRMSKDGLIAYNTNKPMTVRFDREETESLVGNVDFNKFDDVCEVAHLEISNTCNLNCPYCYVRDKAGKELSTEDWKKIISNLAAAGVFQVSFGGGEPTLRKDFIELAKHVQKCGMNLGMTTNGIKLIGWNPAKLRRYFKQINISWHDNPWAVMTALEFLYLNKIPRGINYCFSKEMSLRNSVVKELARKYKAEILYLVYKPVKDDWENQIAAEKVYKTAKQAASEGLKVAVDGPCINQCMMKRKFVDVDHLGNVYPCSFMRHSLGNLQNQDFKDIWRNRGEQEECQFVHLKKEKESVK